MASNDTAKVHRCNCPHCPVAKEAAPLVPNAVPFVPGVRTFPTPCRSCSGAVWIVGPWTCSECGTAYPGSSVTWATAQTTGTAVFTDGTWTLTQ